MAGGVRAAVWILLVTALMVQVVLSVQLHGLRPAIEEMPPPPSPMAMKAVALGDDQFLYRVVTQWLEDVGDGGGRLRPLRDFDYDRVVAWLKLTDDLDPRSDAVFQLGSTYYGALTDPSTAARKVARLVDYFERAGMADPAARWQWLSWAATRNQQLVKDPGLARRTAMDLLSLRTSPTAPSWLPLLAIPLLRVSGDNAEAEELISDPDMIERRRIAIEKLKQNEGRP